MTPLLCRIRTWEHARAPRNGLTAMLSLSPLPKPAFDTSGPIFQPMRASSSQRGSPWWHPFPPRSPLRVSRRACCELLSRLVASGDVPHGARREAFCLGGVSRRQLVGVASPVSRGR